MSEQLGLLETCGECRDTGRVFDERLGESRPCSCRSIPEPPPPALPDPGKNRIGAWHRPESGAPGTERDAAILVYPRTGTARTRVLEYLASCGERGATDEEIADALELRLYTAAPRRNELKADGWVVSSGRKRTTTTGTPAAVWVVSERGRAELERRRG